MQVSERTGRYIFCLLANSHRHTGAASSSSVKWQRGPNVFAEGRKGGGQERDDSLRSPQPVLHGRGR